MNELRPTTGHERILNHRTRYLPTDKFGSARTAQRTITAPCTLLCYANFSASCLEHTSVDTARKNAQACHSERDLAGGPLVRLWDPWSAILTTLPHASRNPVGTQCGLHIVVCSITNEWGPAKNDAGLQIRLKEPKRSAKRIPGRWKLS